MNLKCSPNQCWFLTELGLIEKTSLAAGDPHDSDGFTGVVSSAAEGASREMAEWEEDHKGWQNEDWQKWIIQTCRGGVIWIG